MLAIVGIVIYLYIMIEPLSSLSVCLVTTSKTWGFHFCRRSLGASMGMYDMILHSLGLADGAGPQPQVEEGTMGMFSRDILYQYLNEVRDRERLLPFMPG